MTDLLKGKAATFVWGDEQQKAFDFVREKLLASVHLASPDFELPFHLETDAGEDDKGGELYQLPSVPVDKQCPYFSKLHAPENHAMIFFLSKAFNETQGLKPPFYLEGDALLWGTEKFRYYALSSRFPLYTYSDHMPLNWMQKTDKGPISSFIIERLSEIETVHQYIIQGRLNAIPIADLVHFHGGKHATELEAVVLDGVCRCLSALTPLNPPRSGSPASTDIAIMVPHVEVVPMILALYLLSAGPFALLIPVGASNSRKLESYVFARFGLSPLCMTKSFALNVDGSPA
jgi:hypothetical protein